MKSSASRSGFTLIEISIVLVIIALVAGSILIGHEMIYAAKIRKVIAESHSVKAAVNAFKLKYTQFPGDYSGAAATWPAAISGNGNGTMECYQIIGTPPYPDHPDCYNVMHHLQLAGMIWGGNYQPISAIVYPLPPGFTAGAASSLETGYFTVSYSNTWTNAEYAHQVTLSAIKYPVADVFILLNLLATWGTGTPVGILGKHAQAIDGKIDDGLPFSGVVKSRTPQLGEAEELSCTLIDGSNMYNINSPYYTCALSMPLEK